MSPTDTGYSAGRQRPVGAYERKMKPRGTSAPGRSGPAYSPSSRPRPPCRRRPPALVLVQASGSGPAPRRARAGRVHRSCRRRRPPWPAARTSWCYASTAGVVALVRAPSAPFACCRRRWCRRCGRSGRCSAGAVPPAVGVRTVHSDTLADAGRVGLDVRPHVTGGRGASSGRGRHAADVLGQHAASGSSPTTYRDGRARFLRYAVFAKPPRARSVLLFF